MNGTKAVHPGVTTALFSSCNSVGGGGKPAEPRPQSAYNFKPEILASNPYSFCAVACHSAPLSFKLLCIECNMWGCYVRRVDPPPECCGICPQCISVAWSCGIPPVHTVSEARLKNKITFCGIETTKT